MSPDAIRLMFRLRIVRAAMSAMYLKGFILKYIGIAVNVVALHEFCEFLRSLQRNPHRMELSLYFSII